MTITLQIAIALLIIGIATTLYHLQTRTYWTTARKIQNKNLKFTHDELVEKHPNELRDMLTNARHIQTINRAYLMNPTIREQDRARAQELQSTTEQQIEQLHAAIVESVEKRGSQGIVTPSYI